jgi:hypothetical protein
MLNHHLMQTLILFLSLVGLSFCLIFFAHNIGRRQVLINFIIICLVSSRVLLREAFEYDPGRAKVDIGQERPVTFILTDGASVDSKDLAKLLKYWELGLVTGQDGNVD